MAALTADITYKFDPRYEIGLMQAPAVATDIYYRGGLAHWDVSDSPKLILTPADADEYAGVVSEHRSATAGDLVWVAGSGRWYFACTNFAKANLNSAFAIQSGDLTDNPATLDVQSTGDAGACGVLWKINTDATDGWLNTDARSDAANA